jgi:predicted Na+-dependent transporter
MTLVKRIASSLSKALSKFDKVCMINILVEVTSLAQDDDLVSLYSLIDVIFVATHDSNE